MRKSASSQWNFGELFPAEQIRRVLSVSELTQQVKRLLEKQVGSVWVSGEITNFRAQASGHIYFTLKDEGSQLSCVLFRNEPVAHRELLEDGQKVLLQGELTVYEARGQYQLRVQSVELQGVGALQLKFEKLKQKLAAEGLFAAERKRPLPPYPQRIGLITSPTGAAIRDVLHVVQRRNPALEIVLAPCRVQGEGAAGEIAEAIRRLNELSGTIRDNELPLSLILVTRGGGSLEDLWAFNEEIVARAIFESAVPVVSAVGHEIDFTIADFVADLRAATPSAAAELITEGVFSSRQFISSAAITMNLQAWRLWNRGVEECLRLGGRMSRAHPRRRIEELSQRCDDVRGDLTRAPRQKIRELLGLAQGIGSRLLAARPTLALKQHRQAVHNFAVQLRERVCHQLENAGFRFATQQARLNLLGPEQVLSRGYSITQDAKTGEVLRDAKKLKPGQLLRTRLKTGTIDSRVAD